MMIQVWSAPRISSLALSLVLFLALFLALPYGLSHAGEAEIVAAKVVPEREGTYQVHVTIRHADTGWDHYADGWAVELPDGTRIGYRTLYHPHVEEQPFTRSLSGLQIPQEVSAIVIRAHDSVHGYSKATLSIPVPRD